MQRLQMQRKGKQQAIARFRASGYQRGQTLAHVRTVAQVASAPDAIVFENAQRLQVIARQQRMLAFAGSYGTRRVA